MRIALAEISQETCSFTPVLSTLNDFKKDGLDLGKELLEKAKGIGRVGGFLAAVEKETVPIEPLPIILARANPSGRLTTDTLGFLRDNLLDGLSKALPVDGLFLSLHGATASECIDDVAGYILDSVRKVVGPNIPVVVPLDHHANLTEQMVETANLMVGDRTQPHTAFETGVAAANLLFRLVRNEITPTKSWQKIPMIAPQDNFMTSVGPMKEWFDLARDVEKRPGVISVSTFPMQPWLDVNEAGWSVLVYTENDPGLARYLTVKLANKAWELRERFWASNRLSPEESIRQARSSSGLVILSDMGDCVNGGAPGDSTCILHEMLRQKIDCPVFIFIIDKEVVEAASKAGVGKEISVWLGGKMDNIFSKPAHISATVKAISDGFTTKLRVHGYSELGRTVLLEIGNIKIVVCEIRSNAMMHPIFYTHLGLELPKARMVMLKTGSSFQFYKPWTERIIRVDSPGMTQSNLRAFTWNRVPRPLYPLDDLQEWQAEA